MVRDSIHKLCSVIRIHAGKPPVSVLPVNDEQVPAGPQPEPHATVQASLAGSGESGRTRKRSGESETSFHFQRKKKKDEEATKNRAWRVGILVAGFLTVALTVAVAVALNREPDAGGAVGIGSTSSLPAAVPPTVDRTTVTATTTTITTSPAISSTSAGDLSSRGGTVYLIDLKPVANGHTPGVSTIGGNKRTCAKGLLFGQNNFQGAGAPTIYNIPKNAKTFAVSYGIDSQARPGLTVHFQIYLDDVAQGPGSIVGVYDMEDVSIPVDGKSRIGLQANYVDTNGVGYVGDATWCDPRFTG
ncbi:NPCBM/NEW2 domain-containing protein [Nocardia sp. CA-128927]|uniref:NPCBM/NEW2 domain-containing protein n=1 Tax=Nocardia sp. CA-128927 TaxID=3239975 RepID=UPI003D985CE2